MKKQAPTKKQREENAAKNAPIVARIDALRKERGLRVDAMCAGAKITQSALSQWRQGWTVASVEKVRQFADFFGVSFEWLFTGVETEKAAAPEGDGVSEKQAELNRRLRAHPEMLDALLAILPE